MLNLAKIIEVGEASRTSRFSYTINYIAHRAAPDFARSLTVSDEKGEYIATCIPLIYFWRPSREA